MSKTWKSHVIECSDEVRLRAFAEFISVKPEPTREIEEALRRLKYVEGLEGTQGATLTVALAVLDRAEELTFFGSTATIPRVLDTQWTEWWEGPKADPEEFPYAYYAVTSSTVLTHGGFVFKSFTILDACKVFVQHHSHVLVRLQHGLKEPLFYWESEEAWKVHNISNYPARCKYEEIQEIANFMAYPNLWNQP